MAALYYLFLAIVIIEHLFFLYMEMFAWETLGKNAFKGSMPVELFKPTKKLAANQGLYNGFLAAGLIWSFLIKDAIWSKNVAYFFLTCVVVAGIYGAMTASKKILYIQAFPAVLALLFLYLK